MKSFSYQYAPPKNEREGAVRRNDQSLNGLVTTLHNGKSKTVYDVVQHSAKTFGNKHCLGYRRTIKVHVETRYVQKEIDGELQKVAKDWTYWELGPYEFISYKNFGSQSIEVGQGLRASGLKPGDRIQIYAKTSAFWMISAQGAISQSMPVVTAYDTLGPEGLSHSIKEAESKAMFTDATLLNTLEKPLEIAPHFRIVIYDGEADEEDVKHLKERFKDLKLIRFEEFLETGRNSKISPTPPNAEDTCCIMYTSGSTGTPKGVVLSHKNIVVALAGLDAAINGIVGPNDFLLCFLPLAHILEFAFEMLCILWGGVLGYAGIKTLTEMNMRNCKGDIVEFRPTIMIGVPAVWEMVRKGINKKVSGMPTIVQKIFWGAFHMKSKMIHWGIPGTSVIDSIFFKKIKQATGGRLRFCFNGGSPLASSTRLFLTVVLAPMLVGYGLTETCAGCTIMVPNQWNTEAVGPPLLCLEMKLRDVPEAGYFSNANKQQGEICVRGDNICKGYFTPNEETQESFVDGWFCTGDIGEWTPDGQMRIIDRKKNLVKTLNGEYIALEKLESIYRTSHFVANICVYADSNKTNPVAIVVPNEQHLREVGENKGVINVRDGHWEDICNNPKVQRLIFNDLIDTAKKRGLRGIEILDGVVLSPEEFTPENGLVTSAQKLQRRLIKEKFDKEIDETYNKLAAVGA